ncbi:MAG TPA: hypothetical protein PLH92_17215 [Mycobacterium sp.]|nr:hypothetical protein [Mycobacterium sp.]HQC78448.1 hypothetical protein [Mycobacterium sp.]
MSDTWEGLLDALAAAPVFPGAKCRGKPHLFDEAGPDEPPEVVQARQGQALGLCHRCPSLTRCETWFNSLPPRKRPGGVIAGQVHHWHTTTRPKETTTA